MYFDIIPRKKVSAEPKSLATFLSFIIVGSYCACHLAQKKPVEIDPVLSGARTLFNKLAPNFVYGSAQRSMEWNMTKSTSGKRTAAYRIVMFNQQKNLAMNVYNNGEILHGSNKI